MNAPTITGPSPAAGKVTSASDGQTYRILKVGRNVRGQRVAIAVRAGADPADTITDTDGVTRPKSLTLLRVLDSCEAAA